MVNANPVRVMIVDDHAIVRSGIRFSVLAFDDLLFVAEAASGSEALDVCSRLSGSESMPDVILMDMMMPDMNGVATTRAILERYPEVLVIALSSFAPGHLIQEALQAGAIGYLLKDTAIDGLADAIRAAKTGRAMLAPVAAMTLTETCRRRAPTPEHKTSAAALDALSSREREVVALVVGGLSNAQIARRLDISLSTARCHVSTILSKWGAANRAEAAALAVKHGIAA